MQILTQVQINKLRDLYALNQKSVQELGEFLEEIYPQKLDGEIVLAEKGNSAKLGELLEFPEKFPNIGKRENPTQHTD